jgi:hypothetical protein
MNGEVKEKQHEDEKDCGIAPVFFGNRFIVSDAVAEWRESSPGRLR